MFEILNIPIGMFRILNVPWANWNSYLEGGGLQGEEIVKSTLFCKVHYVLNSDIKVYKSCVLTHTLITEQMYISENASSPGSLLIGKTHSFIPIFIYIFCIQLQCVPTDSLSFSPPHTESTRRFFIYKFLVV